MKADETTRIYRWLTCSSRATPTRHGANVVGAYGEQDGTLGVIHDRLINGNVVVENPSGPSYAAVIDDWP